jgi:hypothetical protein
LPAGERRGFAVRQLYTDRDEMLFDTARPVILNGIEEVITRPDLADRSIFLTLPPVADARRQSERELWRQFELARPRILGALLDLVVHGLRTLPGIGLDRLPRMADFALWGAACETALWPPGTFGRAYEANRKSAIEGIIDADPVAAFVREIMAERSSWMGTAVDLLRLGADGNSDRRSDSRTGWPKSPRALAGRLRRAQTFLRALGIDIAFSREGREGSRMISIRARLESTVSTVSNVRHNGFRSGSGQPPPAPTGAVREGHCRADLAGRGPAAQAVSVTVADDADGADATRRLGKPPVAIRPIDWSGRHQSGPGSEGIRPDSGAGCLPYAIQPGPLRRRPKAAVREAGRRAGAVGRHAPGRCA